LIRRPGLLSELRAPGFSDVLKHDCKLSDIDRVGAHHGLRDRIGQNVLERRLAEAILADRIDDGPAAGHSAAIRKGANCGS
jgi:hypothetical protein